MRDRSGIDHGPGDVVEGLGFSAASTILGSSLSVAVKPVGLRISAAAVDENTWCPTGPARNRTDQSDRIGEVDRLVRRAAAEFRLKTGEHLCSPGRSLDASCGRDNGYTSARMIGVRRQPVGQSGPAPDLPQRQSKRVVTHKSGPIESTGYCWQQTRSATARGAPG